MNWHRIARQLRSKLDVWIERPHAMFKALPVRTPHRGVIVVDADVRIGLI
jgi:hypothetical protein